MRALAAILGLIASAACDLAPATPEGRVPPRALGELSVLGSSEGAEGMSRLSSSAWAS